MPESRPIYRRRPPLEPRLPAHLRAVVPHGCAAHPRLPRQDLRGRDRRRADRRRQARLVRPGPGDPAGDGNQDRPGARLSAAGRRAAAFEGPRRAPQPWPAHHRRGRARQRAGGCRPAALRDRGGVLARPAEHADGQRDRPRRLGQLPDRAAGRRRRRRRLHAQRRRAQGRRGGDPARDRHRRDAAALAVRLLADRRGVQPDDGRRRDQHGDRAAGRQAALRHRGPGHPRRSRPTPSRRSTPSSPWPTPKSCSPRCRRRCCRPTPRSTCATAFAPAAAASSARTSCRSRSTARS